MRSAASATSNCASDGSLVERRLETLSPQTYEKTVAIAELADGIRGYEGVKLRNVERFRSEVARLEGT